MVASLEESSDLAHDLLHVERVYAWALRIAHATGADLDISGAAALLHDLVEVPKESSARAEASARSAAASTPLLRAAGYDAAAQEAITNAIRSCSWSRGEAPETPEAAALQDADRLDAIGAVGIARTFTTAQAMASRGHPLALYSRHDPLAKDRPAEDKAYAVDHFRRKLLTLAAGMHTDLGRQEAARRHALMEAFLAP